MGDGARTGPAARAVASLPRAVRNVLANWTGHVVGVAVGFFLSPLIVHHLGPSAYGVWTLVTALTAYLGLLDLGVRSAVTRYVARCEGEGNRETGTRVAATALTIFAVMAGVAVVAATLLGLTAPRVFHIPPEYETPTLMVAVLAGATIGVALVSGALGGILAGLQRFDLLCVVDVAGTLLRAALVLGVIGAGGGLVALAAAQLTASAAAGGLTAWLGRRVYPELRLRPAWSRAHARLIVAYGGYAFVAQLASSVIDRAGVIVIGAFLPMTAVAVYGIAGGLIDYARALVGGIRVTLAPRASVMEGRGQADAVRALALQAVRYCTLLAMSIAAVLALRGATFIGLWMGPDYGAASGPVVAILAVRLLFLGATGAAANVLLGTSHERAVAGVVVAEAVVAVVTMALLVPPLGVAGAAWGTAAPTAAAAILAWPWLLRRALGVRVGRYLASGWGLPVAALLPLAGATWLVERWWPAPSLPVFAVQLALVAPVALAGVWGVGLSATERSRLRQFAREHWPRGTPAAG
jgi:O-antigen/teichoic acid export membrane protein